MKVRVYHDYYGCETGCCGHTVELENGKECFEFSHPETLAEARQLAEQVIKRVWPECLDSIDWDSLVLEPSSC